MTDVNVGLQGAQFAVKAVMFDLDGTLIHSAPEIAIAANKMLAALQLPTLPVAKIQSYIGEGAQVLIKRCLTGELYAEPEPSLYAEAQHLFFEYYAEVAVESQPYEGALACVQSLWKKGYKLACVTNKPEKFTLPLLEKSGLADFFDIVVSGDSLPKKKPDPMPLQHICKTLDVAEYEAMLVGDSDTDIAAAHAAGCFIVTVSYGYNQGRPIDNAKVDAAIQHLTDLPAMISKLP